VDSVDPSWLSVSPLELDGADLAERNGDTTGSVDRVPVKPSVQILKGGSVLVDASRRSGRSRCGT